MRIIGVVQARMGSTRLPGKALALIEGEPMTWHVVRRLRQASELNGVALAIPTADIELIHLARNYSIPYFVGSETDLIGRIYGAACAFNADAIVRITGDCPFVDPDIVDRATLEYRAGRQQYVCNVLPQTFPDGLDVEVYSIHLLSHLNSELESETDREWFPVYVWDSLRPEFMSNIVSEEDNSHLRWTVDRPEDLEFAREVYWALGKDFRMADVLRFLRERPELVIFDELEHKRGQVQ